MRRILHTLILGTLVSCAFLRAASAQTSVAGITPLPVAGNILAQNSEYRFQLDLHVNDAALAKMLPAGWISNAATSGAAKDANVRLIFIDEANINGPDNKVLGKGSNQLAYLAAPVKQAAGPGTGQMILGGIAVDAATPDGFGVYLKAGTASMTHSATAAGGAVIVTEDWDFAATSGEHLQLHVKYTRGAANKTATQTNFYNPADPAHFQIFKTEQATDITRNVTTAPPDRVSEFSFKAGGGKFAALLDGSEKPLSWDSQPVYFRTVLAPSP